MAKVYPGVFGVLGSPAPHLGAARARGGGLGSPAPHLAGVSRARVARLGRGSPASHLSGVLRARVAGLGGSGLAAHVTFTRSPKVPLLLCYCHCHKTGLLSDGSIYVL